ncbi:MAG: 3-deoxy-D-manno-octulosonic acid transferase [Phycisphaerae bacterium]|nr:3-deoxy-D-manno-octulosonic acid transferase [Phycisphaerae bacterium]
MRFLLDVVYVLAGIAVSPILLYRAIRHGRYRRGWGQRFGRVDRKDPQKKCIWLHAVSVGEINAAQTLVAEIEKQLPDFEIVISTTTDTGFAQAGKLFGHKCSVFYFPFDLSWVTRRAFSRLDPSICLLMELEVWPNFVFTARGRNVPVVVLNGRISDRSFARYRKIKRITRTFFGKLDCVLAQTQQYAERFRELGCPAERVLVTSSLKYDTAQVADRVEGAESLAQQLNLAGARLWVAGGTGDEEEKIILDVYRSLLQDGRFGGLRLAVVPRKPERFNEVAELIERMAFPLVRYSQLKDATRGEGVPPLRGEAILALHSKDEAQPSHTEHLAISLDKPRAGRPRHKEQGRDALATKDKGETPSSQSAVILGDTMGDLRKFYSLATIIFVGRSLVPMGGSDMMEAAALGKCTVFGPHAFNFRQTVEVLLQGQGALLVQDGEDLRKTMEKCLSDPAYAKKIAQSGQAVIRQNQGATARTMEVLRKVLKT